MTSGESSIHRVKRLPIRLIGYRPDEVLSAARAMEAEHQARAAELSERQTLRATELRRVQERQRSLSDMLSHLKAEMTLLHTRVLRAKSQAPALQEAAKAEVDRLRREAAVREDELARQIAAVEAAIRETDEELRSTVERVRQVLDSAPPSTAATPREMIVDQGFSDIVASVFADRRSDEFEISHVAGDLFRAEVREPSARLLVNGAPRGVVTGIVIGGHPSGVVGYQVAADDGSPLGIVPAGDVAAVRRRTIIARGVPQFLAVDELPRRAGFAIHPVSVDSDPLSESPDADGSVPQPGGARADAAPPTPGPTPPSEEPVDPVPAAHPEAAALVSDREAAKATPGPPPMETPEITFELGDADRARDEVQGPRPADEEDVVDFDLGPAPTAVEGEEATIPDFVIGLDDDETPSQDESVPDLSPEDGPLPASDPGPTSARGPLRPDSGAAPAVGPDVLAFLEGKVVGRDILDSDGQMVASRGERITPEVVARVEEAHRLPDLIVNMTLPPDAT